MGNWTVKGSVVISEQNKMGKKNKQKKNNLLTKAVFFQIENTITFVKCFYHLKLPFSI